MDFNLILKDININLNEKQLNQFKIYYEYLIEKNKVMNLTAITDETQVYIKHFYDSLLLSKCIDINNKELLDVGSGAGFPSIPLAILNPSLKVTIIDALNKRIVFLNDLINKLGLKNVSAIHYRAEDYSKVKREYFDIVTARAVARLNILAELCLPLVKVNGSFIALKGNDKEELVEATNALNILGSKLVDEFKFNLPSNLGKRNLYLFQKNKNTPLKYPRIFKDIKAKPL